MGMVWYTRTYVPLEAGRVIDFSIWYKVSATSESEPTRTPKLIRLSEKEGNIVYAELLASRGSC